MKPFVMHLESTMQHECVPDVVSFVGADTTGNFGILAGHARMISVLGFGLARFRTVGRGWEFLALPGALLYFVDGALHLSTRRYLRGSDHRLIATRLQEELAAEEHALEALRRQLRQLEQEMLKRLWKMGRAGPEGA
jgi:F-type H+-transporting ATPase subunit epsilon